MKKLIWPRIKQLRKKKKYFELRKKKKKKKETCTTRTFLHTGGSCIKNNISFGALAWYGLCKLCLMAYIGQIFGKTFWVFLFILNYHSYKYKWVHAQVLTTAVFLVKRNSFLLLFFWFKASIYLYIWLTS